MLQNQDHKYHCSPTDYCGQFKPPTFQTEHKYFINFSLNPRRLEEQVFHYHIKPTQIRLISGVIKDSFSYLITCLFPLVFHVHRCFKGAHLEVYANIQLTRKILKIIYKENICLFNKQVSYDISLFSFLKYIIIFFSNSKFSTFFTSRIVTRLYGESNPV